MGGGGNMAHASSPPASKDKLAEARDRFLAAEPVDPATVRKPILASWWRSRQWHVAADHIDLSYLHDPDVKSTLARAADPVLRQLHEQLDGQPISIILTDADGVVLTRMTADHDLERSLDRVMLAPGFSYAEERVGTNGIGTALESGGPAHVFGHEHYAEHLEGLACAGVPIHDPVSGKTVGVIDLTCWRKNADPLLVSPVKATADQITQAMLAAAAVATPEVPAPRTAMYLPGLVGSGVLWLRACREAEALYDASDWMTLEGERGVGKLALARAVHQRRNPAARFHVLDAEEVGQDWLTKTRAELLDGAGML